MTTKDEKEKILEELDDIYIGSSAHIIREWARVALDRIEARTREELREKVEAIPVVWHIEVRGGEEMIEKDEVLALLPPRDAAKEPHQGT